MNETYLLCTFWQTSHNKKRPKKEVQTHGEGPRRGWTGDMGLFVWHFLVWTCCFFCVSIVFRSYFACANVCISLPSQNPAFLQPPMATPSVGLTIHKNQLLRICTTKPGEGRVPICSRLHQYIPSTYNGCTMETHK